MFSKRVRLAVFAVASGLFAASALSDPFDDGIAALDRGDFTAAHRLLCRSPSKGCACRNSRRRRLLRRLGRARQRRQGGRVATARKVNREPGGLQPRDQPVRSGAVSGDAAAQVMLGAAYSAGFRGADGSDGGPEVDPRRRGAGPRAWTVRTGRVVPGGRWVSKDVPEGIRWLSLAAQQGDASAQLKLAVLAEQGFVAGHDSALAPIDDSRDLERTGGRRPVEIRSRRCVLGKSTCAAKP